MRRLGPGFRDSVQHGFRRLMESPIRPVLFAVPTAVSLWPMQSGSFDTATSFLPSLAVLAAYGVFFAFGWLLYAHTDMLPSFSRHAWKQIGLALLLWPLNCVAAVLLAFTRAVPESVVAVLTILTSGLITLPFVFVRVLTIVTSALVAWLFVFGITGLFVRYLDRSISWLRYMTDASYWCYLVHLPLMFWLAALLSPLPVASPVKVLLLIVLAVLTLLIAYDYAVRATIVGEWLNGRRYPRLRPVDCSEIPRYSPVGSQETRG